MKKTSAMILALAMLLQCLLLGACTEGTPGQTTSPESSEEQTEAKPVSSLIFDGESIYYPIIRGGYADETEIGAAVALNLALKKIYTGEAKSSIKEDFFIGQKKGEYYDIEGCEILVGMTNRRESLTVYQTLSQDEYAIKAVGEKIVIIGYDPYVTLAAVDAFIEKYLSAPAERLELDVALDIRGKASLRKIKLNEEATYRIMTYNLGCMVSEDAGGEKECVDILIRYLPDIYGLQECNKAVHTKVLSELPDYYAFANETHTGKSTVNYTPIIYNTRLFKLLESDLVWLRGRYTGTNTKSLNWAVFEDNSGVKFALVNYHGAVCSNSYKGFENYTSAQLSAQANEWKLDNVAQVIEIKNAIIAKYGNIPVMVTGDNNFNSSSQQYANVLADGFTDAERTARISKMTGYKTSYGYGSVPGEGLSIDHVFGMGGVDFVTHTVVRGDDVWKASDHCPVYVDFNLK